MHNRSAQLNIDNKGPHNLKPDQPFFNWFLKKLSNPTKPSIGFLSMELLYLAYSKVHDKLHADILTWILFLGKIALCKIRVHTLASGIDVGPTFIPCPMSIPEARVHKLKIAEVETT